VLSSAGINTIFAGKWHLAASEDTRGSDPWANHDVNVAFVESAGFDAGAAVYITNMDRVTTFSHNTEWMVAESNAMVDQAAAADQPFFL
jgi:arylsulfatase A-like enzyme